MNEDRLRQREEFILECTEAICGMLRDEGVSRGELAKRIGWVVRDVNDALDGESLTLRDLSDMAWALGYQLVLRAEMRG